MVSAFLLAPSLHAEPADVWAPFAPLIGEWTGEGSGSPGQGNGGFTFEKSLQGKALVRRNFAEYPAAKDRPAFRHDDLMIVYRDGERTRADYWDSEGHVIRYSVTAANGAIVFLSDPGPGPRFRLTYAFPAANRTSIAFEIAPPGKEFKPYITAAAVRRAG